MAKNNGAQCDDLNLASEIIDCLAPMPALNNAIFLSLLMGSLHDPANSNLTHGVLIIVGLFLRIVLGL